MQVCDSPSAPHLLLRIIANECHVSLIIFARFCHSALLALFVLASGFAGDFCAKRLPSVVKICSDERESFAVQKKAISDRLVNEVAA
jgi:hypothetical protein